MWEVLWDQAYRKPEAPAPAADPTFDTSGWVSSYTGAPIAEPEMREWVDHTVTRIRAHAGPGRASWRWARAWACLLFRLAPECERYVGLDFAESALEHVSAVLKSAPLPQVELLRAAADAIPDSVGRDFDVVVINSVAQYFPSADYLTRVLDEAVGRLRPGGAVFVGDLRPIEAAGAQHASVALLHAPETARAGDVRRQMDARLARDGELLISPAFFDAFVAQRPDLAVVSCNLKRGRAANELVKFRYDVVLRRQSNLGGVRLLGSPQQEEDKKRAPVTPQRISAPTGDAMQSLRSALHGNPAALVVAGLPNARVAGDLFVLDECRAAKRDLGVPELRAESSARARAALDPEDVFSLSTDYGIEVRPRPEHFGLFDASFARKDIGGLAAVARDARPSVEPGHRARATFRRSGSQGVGQAGWRAARPPAREAARFHGAERGRDPGAPAADPQREDSIATPCPHLERRVSEARRPRRGP